MHTILRERLFALSLLLVAGGLFARPALADGLGIVIDGVDASAFPTVRAFVSVVNSDGATVTGLDARAFQVQEDGKPVEGLTVEAIAQSQEPIATAIVLDVSGSMADQQKLDRTVEAANAFVDQLGAAERATVVAYSSRVTVIQDYTGEKAALKTALDSLVAKGDRVLYDAVAQTVRRQDALTQQRRKPIILVASGDDVKSTETLEGSLNAVGGSSSPIYAIGLGSDVKKDVLDRFAARSGGRAIYVADPGQLKPTFTSISDQLRRQYVVRYTSKLAADTRQHGLAIAASASGQQVTGLTSFALPASAVAPPSVVAVATTAPLPTSAPVPTAAPVAASAVGQDNGVSAAAIAFVVLLLLLLGAAIWFLVVRSGPSAADTRVAAPKPAVVPSDGDATVVIGAPTAVGGADPNATQLHQEPGDATVVRMSPDKRRPRARLVITRRGEASEVVLDRPEVIVGRDDDVSVPIKDPQASRQHAKIVREGDQYWIEDLRSLNGTQVNGEAVTRRQLVSNDHIGIGETVLTFVVDSR